MTRDLYIRTKSEIRRYPLGKNVRPLTVVRHRLFRTDDALMISDTGSDHQLVMYDIESTQPYYQQDILSPDLTMAYTDIAKQAGRASVSRLSFLNTVNPMWIMYGIIGIVILYAVATGGVISRRSGRVGQRA